MPLYLFQVSAHSRPVALQRKPRYSTLAKRKGRGYFRNSFRVKTYTDFCFVFFSEFCCKSGWQHHIPRWRLRHIFTSFSNLEWFPHSSGLKRKRKYKKKKESGLRLLYCGRIIPDEPIRLVVSLNSGVLNVQGSIFIATHVQQRFN